VVKGLTREGETGAKLVNWRTNLTGMGGTINNKVAGSRGGLYFHERKKIPLNVGEVKNRVGKSQKEENILAVSPPAPGAGKKITLKSGSVSRKRQLPDGWSHQKCHEGVTKME